MVAKERFVSLVDALRFKIANCYHTHFIRAEKGLPPEVQDEAKRVLERLELLTLLLGVEARTPREGQSNTQSIRKGGQKTDQRQELSDAQLKGSSRD